MNTDTLKIKEFWDEQAKKYGDSSLATSPDTISFGMELEQLYKMVFDGAKVLDVGCGNGVKGVALAKKFSCSYVGIDYSEAMVQQACELKNKAAGHLRGTVQFKLGDVLNEQMVSDRNFDIIISSRCLINLGSIENQAFAVKNLCPLLKNDGIFLLFENSLQSLKNINDVRQTFNLPVIQVRWHNNYIDEAKFFSAIKNYFYVDKVIAFKSTYFLISRTLNALLTPEGQEIDYLSELNRLSSKLPALGDYSPEKLFVLKRVIS